MVNITLPNFNGFLKKRFNYLFNKIGKEEHPSIFFSSGA